MKTALLIILTVLVTVAKADELESMTWLLKTQVMPNTQIDSVSYSTIKGIYSVRAGNNQFYFHPETWTLIFGEMLNMREGRIVSEHQQQQVMKAEMAEASLSALIINPAAQGMEVVEFMSLNCPYCGKYHNYITQQPDIKRIVFFVDDGNPISHKKINHVLCSQQPELDMSAIYAGKNMDYTTCESAEKRRLSQAMFARQNGVMATPLVVFGDTRVEGFQPQTIEKIIKSQKEAL